MKILYLGDVYGEPGMRVVETLLPKLRAERNVDFVIAQAENVSGGRSMLPADMERLQKAGVDFFTGGNHTYKRKAIYPLLKDDSQPVIGPANMPDCPGKGWKFIDTPKGRVLVICLLGETFGSNPPKIENPLKSIDTILAINKNEQRVATIVDFHADYSSHKRVIGYYLDGKVSAMIGDHWHVPTADAMVLPKGTAHITDVGTCGPLHSSLGVKTSVIIERWRDGVLNQNEIETEGPLQLCSVLVKVDTKTGLAESIEQIIQTSDTI